MDQSVKTSSSVRTDDDQVRMPALLASYIISRPLLLSGNGHGDQQAHNIPPSSSAWFYFCRRPAAIVSLCSRILVGGDHYRFHG